MDSPIADWRLRHMKMHIDDTKMKTDCLKQNSSESSCAPRFLLICCLGLKFKIRHSDRCFVQQFSNVLFITYCVIEQNIWEVSSEALYDCSNAEMG